MPWPPTTHQDVQDATSSLRGMAQFPAGVLVTAPGNIINPISVSAGVAGAIPIILPTGTVSSLVVRVTTAAAVSGGTVQLGLYDTAATLNSTFGRVPGNLLATGAAISTETTGVKSLAISQTITGGLYWLAALPLVADASFALAGADSQTGRTGVGSASLTAPFVGAQRTGQASLPASFDPPTSIATNVPRVWCSMSAVD
jgi:hypothetical protein